MKVKITKKYSNISNGYFWTVYLNDWPIKCLFDEKEVWRLMNNNDALRELIIKLKEETVYEVEI